MITQAELLHRVKDDDESAFNALYFHYTNSLIRFAYSITQDQRIAEELVDDVFVNLWLKRAKLPIVSNEKVFLYTAVKNACLNHLRSLSTKRVQSIENFLVTEQAIRVEFSPEQYYISKETKKYISDAVKGLPPKCQIVYKMVKEDGLSIMEVAEILSLSYKTVFTQLQIALKKIASAIQ